MKTKSTAAPAGDAYARLPVKQPEDHVTPLAEAEDSVRLQVRSRVRLVEKLKKLRDTPHAPLPS